jgi:ABC-type Zn2+ transport system substrate-binding protein/surface adhesin
MDVGGEHAQVFLSHADSQSIIVVDVESGTLATPLNLTFTPGQLTWVGLSSEDGEQHDHEEDDHDHDDEHDHDH